MSLIGRTLSHYQIVEEISRGGMGVVDRALDLRLNREVALKVLPPELMADADRHQRFVQERALPPRSNIRTSRSSTRSTKPTASTSSRWSWCAARS